MKFNTKSYGSIENECGIFLSRLIIGTAYTNGFIGCGKNVPMCRSQFRYVFGAQIHLHVIQQDDGAAGFGELSIGGQKIFKGLFLVAGFGSAVVSGV